MSKFIDSDHAWCLKNLDLIVNSYSEFLHLFLQFFGKELIHYEQQFLNEAGDL